MPLTAALIRFARNALGGHAREALGGLARTTLDAVYPQVCAGCARALDGNRILCTACTEAIPRLSMGLCARCLARGAEPVGCVAHSGFAVWPAWVYDRRAEPVVHAIKFGGRPALARDLGRELARVVTHLKGAGLVTEVPLHRVRRRERGYNQAGLLADALGDALAVPRAPGLLQRTRPTRAQSSLGARERRRNVSDAFRVVRPDWVLGRQVVIVDDVITSGATLEACLAALKEAGAQATAVTLAWAQ